MTTSSPTNARTWVNPLALARADAANSKHELKRFRAQKERMEKAAAALAETSTRVRIPSALVEAVVREAAVVAEFAREEFGFQEIDPWNMATSPGPSGLMIKARRLEHWLKAAGSDDPLAKAAQRYLLAWETAAEVPGLRNWPTFMKELRAHTKEMNKKTADPVLQRAMASLNQVWQERLKELHGEMLVMAGIQDPSLKNIAEEVLAQDIRPAWTELSTLLSNPASRVRNSEQPTMSQEQARRKLGRALKSLDDIENLGEMWVDVSNAEVEYQTDLLGENSDVSERLVLRADLAGRPVATVVVPHADDETSKLAEVMASMAMQGYYVKLVVATDNSAGAPQNIATDTAYQRRNFPTIRKYELRTAAEHLGVAEVVVLNHGDSGMPNDPSDHSHRLAGADPRQVSRAIAAEAEGSSIVLSIQDAHHQAPYDHADHQVTERGTREAVRQLRAEAVGPVFAHLLRDGDAGRRAQLVLEALRT